MSAVLGPNGGLAFPQPAISPLPTLHEPPAAAPAPSSATPVLAVQRAAALPGHGRPPGPPVANRSTGLIIVIGLHLLLGWALASGLARKAVEIVKKPIDMVIVPQELKPPPPPKVEKVREIPKPTTPPPFVPPPDITPPAPPAPVIQQVQQVAPPPAPVVIAPPAPPVEPPKPAVIKQEVAVACPGYQAALANVLEDAFERIGQPGTVTLLLKIKGNRVVDVVPQSGPKAYHNLLVGEIKRNVRCAASSDTEVQALLPVVFQG